MSRAGVALIAGMFAIANAPADATPTDPTPADDKPAGTTSKPAGTTSKPAGTTSKRKAAVTKSKAKHKLKRRIAAKRRSKSKHAKTQVAMLDGRARYGHDNMPPGFSWPPNPAMKAAKVECEHGLDEQGVHWKAARREGKIADPIVVPALDIGGIKYVSTYQKPPHTFDCQLVRTLTGLGPALYALGVREVRFGSIYRNTLVRAHGVTKNMVSRHALGLAMDIKAFVDDTGRLASVELDYLKGDKLLHEIEDTINNSNSFRIVLTPGNDPISHYDHFHVEASVDYSAFR